jgi:hypothetical protein
MSVNQLVNLVAAMDPPIAKSAGCTDQSGVQNGRGWNSQCTTSVQDLPQVNLVFRAARHLLGVGLYALAHIRAVYWYCC